MAWGLVCRKFNPCPKIGYLPPIPMDFHFPCWMVILAACPVPGILHFHLVRDTHFEFEDSSPNLITSDNQPLPGMDPGMIPVNFRQVCFGTWSKATPQIGGPQPNHRLKENSVFWCRCVFVQSHKGNWPWSAPNSTVAPQQGTALALRSATDLRSSEELPQPTEPHSCEVWGKHKAWVWANHFGAVRRIRIKTMDKFTCDPPILS